MICKFVQTVMKKDTVLITINKTLVDQYLELIQVLKLDEIVVADVNDLGVHVGKNK
jgi:hypothetical protein